MGVRRLPDGKTTHLRYCLSPVRRAWRTHHRPVRSAACSLPSLRRLRTHVDLTRITLVLTTKDTKDTKERVFFFVSFVSFVV